MVINKNINTFIFDLDGVVVSTDEYHYDSWKETFQKIFNHEIEETAKDVVRGVSRAESLDKLLEKYDIKDIDNETKERALIYKNETYVKKINSMTTESVLEGVEDVLKFLKERNANVILASSSKNAKNILEKINFIYYFDSIVNVSKLKKLKPDPEIFLEAAKLANETVDNCVVIEDAQSGIDGAKLANMQVIAYNNSLQKLYNYNVEVRNHKELLSILFEHYGCKKREE